MLLAMLVLLFLTKLKILLFFIFTVFGKICAELMETVNYKKLELEVKFCKLNNRLTP